MSRASELARLLESEVEDANHFRNKAAYELRLLDRVNAELVEVGLVFARWAQAGMPFKYPPGSLQQLIAALTSATKETK